MDGSQADVDEVFYTQVKQRKGSKMTCDIGEATGGLGNEL